MVALEMGKGSPDMIFYNNITRKWMSYNWTLHRTLQLRDDEESMQQTARLMCKAWEGGANTVILDTDIVDAKSGYYNCGWQGWARLFNDISKEVHNTNAHCN